LPAVRDKVAEWIAAGHVQQIEQPAWCTSPLSLVQKYDPVTDTLKERVVLDLSRHVNLFIADKATKLDDLSVSEHSLDTGDFMTSFDLRNQFFHIKLHPDMFKYFGFSLTDEYGNAKFYCFKVLIYGLKPAVYIVTKLLLPVKSFLHSLGIKISLYIDDGRVAAAGKEETIAKTTLTLLILQLAGWNLQWKKCMLSPSRQLLHLGFITDTEKMRYFVPTEKIELLKNLISSLLQQYFNNCPVSAKLVAVVLGKIISMLRSHGDILCIMSRSSQHQLGSHVLLNGWQSNMCVTPAMVKELSYILNILDSANGQYIYTASAMSHTVELAEVVRLGRIVQETSVNVNNLFVSDASDTHAFVYCADGSFQYVREFEFEQSQQQASSGHRELLSIKFALENDKTTFQKFAKGKIFWQTDSQNVFRFLRRGSRRPDIQADIVKIKMLEAELNVKIVPVWTARDHDRITLADIGSKFSTSTDEWSVNRQQLQVVFDHFQFCPTIDAFASVHNKVCERFYALMPQTGAEGVNFFAQTLNPAEKYFCCPPVSLVVSCFKKLCATVDISALLLVPVWTGHSFLPFLFNGVQMQPQIISVFRFHSSFTYSNAASSHMFSQ